MIDFAALPRIALGHLPTPLEPLDRLRTVFGATGGPRLWIKRDDCTGLATGGNKTRKLEYLVADALAQGADTLVTFGAVQSNHARQTAAAAARAGLACELILSDRVRWPAPDLHTHGNVLLDQLLGATLHRVADAAAAGECLRTILQRLADQGRRARVIPAGGSDATGALGYVRAAHELVGQCGALGFVPDAIVHATSSAGTQAGLRAGLATLGLGRVRVIGINVYDPDTAVIAAAVARLTDQVLALLDCALPAPALEVSGDWIGADYGLPTPAMAEAVKAFATTEAVLLDPVYSGKGAAGLLGLLRRGDLAGARHVVFVHTGGQASLPVYRDALVADRPAGPPAGR